MKTNRRSILATATLVLATLALAGTVAAAPRISALKVVPGDSVAVGMVKLSELRTSPLSGLHFQRSRQDDR